jgi:hypothetical protein
MARRISERSPVWVVPLSADGSDLSATGSLAAGEAHIGQVGSPGDVIDVTLSLDTNAYVSGDVLADTQAVATAVRVAAGRAVLQSVTVIDEDDQGTAFDLVFFSANVSLGTENAAASISDADARNCLGFVSIATTDFIDLGGVRIATKTGIGLVLEAAAASTTLYVGAISRGTPTHSASGLRLKLGMLWD